MEQNLQVRLLFDYPNSGKYFNTILVLRNNNKKLHNPSQIIDSYHSHVEENKANHQRTADKLTKHCHGQTCF